MNKGDCELQQQGYRHGIDAISIPYLYPALPVDVSGKYFALDHNRCILCTRCVRTCEEMEGTHTLDISNRGAKNRVVVDLSATFGTSDTCTNCGACVAACPTGALFDKAAAFRGKLNTCQTVRTTCTECPVGCGLLVYTKENRIVEVFGDFDSPVSQGHLCVRGRYETWAEPRQRILQPMVRRHGKLEPATWDEALDAVRQAAKKAKPAQKAVLVSPRLTNETIRHAEEIPSASGCSSRKTKPPCAPTAAAVLTAWRSWTTPTPLSCSARSPAASRASSRPKSAPRVRQRGAKLLIFHTRKSDLDQYADICANVVSLEHKFWDRVAEVLRDAKRPGAGLRPGGHDVRSA